MPDIKTFQEEKPSLESYWRSIVLFGKNVASYKFSLAKSLLEIAQTGKTIVTLDDLAVPFSKNLCEHIANVPKQTTSNSSQFLDACKQYNIGELGYDQLINTTVKKGFNNVIDAFHVVNNEIIPTEFYIKDYSKGSKKIILTDDILKLNELVYYENFKEEVEARWNLVETAWNIGVSPNLLNVEYDETDKRLFIKQDKVKRKDVTSVRGALNGYQKGKCFYCFDDISIDVINDNLCDVDHFFPHVLQSNVLERNLNGVWNLVLTCNKCNRGVNGKFAKVPKIKYLERLHKRNEYLINSHHPLKETLINQNGKSNKEREMFLKRMDSFAINKLIHRWETEAVGEEVF